ncbi:hypothetical protein NDU88_004174 [Pleurodeles waltl]|uniref:Secreted protein n=1 Tax=Pleurodeles waltl TaxID=8319 RepID=A0AAV7L154_PLEWA|nr:hypothetical protein NDU88_004174 [Pleurodeles waltl]
MVGVTLSRAAPLGLVPARLSCRPRARPAPGRLLSPGLCSVCAALLSPEWSCARAPDPEPRHQAGVPAAGAARTQPLRTAVRAGCGSTAGTRITVHGHRRSTNAAGSSCTAIDTTVMHGVAACSDVI